MSKQIMVATGLPLGWLGFQYEKKITDLINILGFRHLIYNRWSKDKYILDTNVYCFVSVWVVYLSDCVTSSGTLPCFKCLTLNK